MVKNAAFHWVIIEQSGEKYSVDKHLSMFMMFVLALNQKENDKVWISNSGQHLVSARSQKLQAFLVSLNRKEMLRQHAKYK
jgi:hypothetical protein